MSAYKKHIVANCFSWCIVVVTCRARCTSNRAWDMLSQEISCDVSQETTCVLLYSAG